MGIMETRAKAFDLCQRLANKPDRVDKLIDLAGELFAQGDDARGTLAEKWVKRLLVGIPLTPVQEKDFLRDFPNL